MPFSYHTRYLYHATHIARDFYLLAMNDVFRFRLNSHYSVINDKMHEGAVIQTTVIIQLWMKFLLINNANIRKYYFAIKW